LTTVTVTVRVLGANNSYKAREASYYWSCDWDFGKVTSVNGQYLLINDNNEVKI